MGVICDMICSEKQIDKKEVIVEIAIKQQEHQRHNSNSKEPKTDQNPTFNSNCNTNCQKSSLQEKVSEDKPKDSNAYPHISGYQPFVYEAPVLDPTISIDKDHPFFYRKYGTEIKKPVVRNSFKATSEIKGDNQLSLTFNNNSNNQKVQARYVTKSSI